MSDNNFPRVQSVSITSAQTAATGTNWTAFADGPCTALDLVNTTGTAIEYRRRGAGETMPIPDQTSRMILGITNASQIEVRRVDTSNTQVTVKAERFHI